MGPFSWNGCQTLHTQSFWWGLSLTCPLLESYFIPTRVIGSIAYTTKDMLQLFKYNTILSICVPFKAHIYDPIMWRPWRWDYPFVTYFFLLQCIDSIMLLRLHFCSKRSFKSSTTLLTFPQKVRAIVERDLPFSLPLSIYQFSGIWDINASNTVHTQHYLFEMYDTEVQLVLAWGLRSRRIEFDSRSPNPIWLTSFSLGGGVCYVRRRTWWVPCIATTQLDLTPVKM